MAPMNVSKEALAIRVGSLVVRVTTIRGPLTVPAALRGGEIERTGATLSKVIETALDAEFGFPAASAVAPAGTLTLTRPWVCGLTTML